MSDFVREVNDGNFEQVGLHSSVQRVSSWQLIFQQSKVNNGAYNGDRRRPRIGIGPRERGFKHACRYLRQGNGTYSKELTEKMQ